MHHCTHVQQIYEFFLELNPSFLLSFAVVTSCMHNDRQQHHYIGEKL